MSQQLETLSTCDLDSNRPRAPVVQTTTLKPNYSPSPNPITNPASSVTLALILTF